MYKVIKLFYDLEDKDHLYTVGDNYPRKGLKPTKERIKELLTDSNRAKIPLIKEVRKK